MSQNFISLFVIRKVIKKQINKKIMIIRKNKLYHLNLYHKLKNLILNSMN